MDRSLFDHPPSLIRYPARLLEEIMNMLIRIIPANHSVTKHSHISRVASSQTADCLDTPTSPMHYVDSITENLRRIRAAHIIGNKYFGNSKTTRKT